MTHKTVTTICKTPAKHRGFILALGFGLALGQAAGGRLLTTRRCRATRTQRHAGFVSAPRHRPNALATHRPRRQSCSHPIRRSRLGHVHYQRTRRLRDRRLQAHHHRQADPTKMTSTWPTETASCRSRSATGRCCIIKRKKVSCRATISSRFTAGAATFTRS